MQHKHFSSHPLFLLCFIARLPHSQSVEAWRLSEWGDMLTVVWPLRYYGVPALKGLFFSWMGSPVVYWQMVFSGRTCSLQPGIAPSDMLAGRSADAAARELLILGYFKPGLAAQYSYSQHTGITREAVWGDWGGTGDCWDQPTYKNVLSFILKKKFLSMHIRTKATICLQACSAKV